MTTADTKTYSVSNMEEFVGQSFGPSAPITVSQDRINQFADSTGDHQWIHVDVERAKAESPFGGPIAHGFLTLSFIAGQLLDLGIFPGDAKGVMNYGLEKVRFLAPVPAGALVSVTATLTGIERKEGGRIVVKSTCTVDIEGGDKPAVLAECVAMVFA